MPDASSTEASSASSPEQEVESEDEKVDDFFKAPAPADEPADSTSRNLQRQLSGVADNLAISLGASLERGESESSVTFSLSPSENVQNPRRQKVPRVFFFRPYRAHREGSNRAKA